MKALKKNSFFFSSTKEILATRRAHNLNEFAMSSVRYLVSIQRLLNIIE